MPNEFKSSELGHGVHSQRGLTEDEKKSIGERISLIGTMLFGSEPGSKHGPSPGLAGVLLGMRANTLIGPKRLQQFTNIIDRMTPDERGVRAKEGGPKLGRGAYGTAYILPKDFPGTVMKRSNLIDTNPKGGVRDMLEEAMDLKNTASDPSNTIKKYLGTVGVLNKNMDFGSTYGDLLDMIHKKNITSDDLSRLDVFTRQFPSQEKLTTKSVPNIDQLREFANFLAQKGIKPLDLHGGNVKYDPQNKKLGLVDLGILRRMPGHPEQYETELPGASVEAGGTIRNKFNKIRFSPSEMLRDAVGEALTYETMENYDEVFKRLLRDKLGTSQPMSRIQDLKNTIDEIIKGGQAQPEKQINWFGGR